jgi:hypothetical protein
MGFQKGKISERIKQRPWDFSQRPWDFSWDFSSLGFFLFATRQSDSVFRALADRNQFSLSLMDALVCPVSPSRAIEGSLTRYVGEKNEGKERGSNLQNSIM